MKQIKMGSWTVEVDVEKTIAFYETYYLITEDCNCDYCVNYVRACDSFPREVMELFSMFGIDPRKEGEVFELSETEDGLHIYNGFYHFVGRIIESPDDDQLENFRPDTSIEISFDEQIDLLPESFPSPVVQLIFQLNIPWLLDS
ncbi:hypothetical protein [Ornithinibacillus halophilus]|uniref:Uncharacterized protein n=1 Tax=Ornithinibacillus halophilus TaxID=930117 RepID=A0A1M5MZS9_9BACI|nr:hypothetical protein [Ornithinibacillus halophilus]SHG82642.1 hypothetical protein SAMN05216225_10688 [Ornithinibacillus halophilus]